MLCLVLLAVALWRFLPAVETTPFHRDEARWVHRVYLLREWRNPFGPRWQDEGYAIGEGSWDERYRMRGQPPVAPYLLGIGLLLQGRDLTANGFWNMDRDDAWNAAHGNMPVPADLRAGRRTSAVIGALTVVVVYLLGRCLTNRVGGAVGALALTFHPLFRETVTRAWSDPPLVLFVALAALAAARLAARPSWPGAVLLGVLLGLGGATKLSPLLVAFPLAALGATILFAERFRRRNPGKRRDRLGWYLLALPALATATFVAAYPYLWPDPVGQTYNLFLFRVDSFEAQGRAWPNAAVESRLEAADRIVNQLSGTWSSAAVALGGEVDRLLETDLVGHRSVAWLDLGVASIGAAMLGGMLWRSDLRSERTLLVAVVFTEAAITALAMRVDYARYHLPILLAVVVCISVAFGHGWTLAGKTYWRARNAGHPWQRSLVPRLDVGE